MARTTVLLADDHPGTAALLRDLLQGAYDVVGKVADGHALVTEAEQLAPDVIVTDIAMSGLDGIEATRRILAGNPDARIVLVSVHTEWSLVEQGLAAGALGYVAKSVAGDELMPTIQAALRGERRVIGALGPPDTDTSKSR